MPSSSKVGVLLVNLGTPDSYQTKDVRRYLREFLSDPRVLDIPALSRFFLVNCIIAPFRSPTSAASYKLIWTEKGSPLLAYGNQVKNLLQQRLGDDFIVELGMRYQNPSMETALQSLFQNPLSKLIVLPLFPQYASATTGSVIEKLFELLKSRSLFPHLSIISEFYDEPLLIEAFAAQIKSYDLKKYDHLLVSFHGLPKRQLVKASPQKTCQANSLCCKTMKSHNQTCYSAQCHKMTSLIAGALELKEKDYTLCFQSRLGKDPWIEPYTANTLKTLAEQGKKHLLVTCPSFICDCLETLQEIEIEYAHLFKQYGGETLTLVKGLNSHPLWIETLAHLIQKENPISCVPSNKLELSLV